MTSGNTPGDNNSGWIGVDLDGTLAFYDHWRGPGHIGEPIPAMLGRVKQWLAEGKEVRIVTARVSQQASVPDWMQAVRAVEAWCFTHLGQHLKVTNGKDFGMVALWDDRAVQVVPNTGVRADGKPD